MRSSQKGRRGLLVTLISFASARFLRIAAPRCGVIAQVSAGSPSGPSSDIGTQRCVENATASLQVVAPGGMSASSLASSSCRVTV